MALSLRHSSHSQDVIPDCVAAGEHVCCCHTHGRGARLDCYRPRPGVFCFFLGVCPDTDSSRLHIHQVRPRLQIKPDSLCSVFSLHCTAAMLAPCITASEMYSHAGGFCCDFTSCTTLSYVYLIPRYAMSVDIARPCLILLQFGCDLQGGRSQGAPGRGHSLVYRNSGCTPLGAHQPFCPVRISCLRKFLPTSMLAFNDSCQHGSFV